MARTGRARRHRWEQVFRDWWAWWVPARGKFVTPRQRSGPDFEAPRVSMRREHGEDTLNESANYSVALQGRVEDRPGHRERACS